MNKLLGENPMPTQHIYAIGVRTGPIKIGVTQHLSSRLSTIQSCCPFEIKLLFSAECNSKKVTPRTIEALCHKLLISKLIRGEWFDIDVATASFFIRNCVSLFPGPRIRHKPESPDTSPLAVIQKPAPPHPPKTMKLLASMKEELDRRLSHR